MICKNLDAKFSFTSTILRVSEAQAEAHGNAGEIKLQGKERGLLTFSSRQ